MSALRCGFTAILPKVVDLKSQEDAPVTGKDVAGYADRVNTSLRDELVKVWLTLALMFTAPDVLRGFIRWGNRF
ncbi:TPA: hypothetical protein ACWV7G_001493 [Salmonella enterica subsp. enterica serovar Muenchen]|nr:hypothetical protein [Salmonella enterica]ECZ0254630.1 hypothetical protein [Salmonella enterica subsp. diarizonae]EIG0951729.1 hypothetical protein [Salmonella enterica subsp. enterica serovar Muenchen]EDQ5532984.1 hypothetical protein [Salmonella enterica subsp. diarizonae]EDS7589438.1 hypothetical protein [Salmonella enterica subsp. diarizonae]